MAARMSVIADSILQIMEHNSLRESSFTVRCSIDRGSLRELRQLFERNELVESVSEAGYAFDSAPDLTKVVEDVTHAVLTVIVTKEALSFGNDLLKGSVIHLIKTWIDDRNERRKAAIESKKEEPIIYDAYGQTISIKKRRKP
jgi:hypothetical protein